jgi:hypothetical protein
MRRACRSIDESPTRKEGLREQQQQRPPILTPADSLLTVIDQCHGVHYGGAARLRLKRIPHVSTPWSDMRY